MKSEKNENNSKVILNKTTISSCRCSVYPTKSNCINNIQRREHYAVFYFNSMTSIYDYKLTVTSAFRNTIAISTKFQYSFICIKTKSFPSLKAYIDALIQKSCLKSSLNFDVVILLIC